MAKIEILTKVRNQRGMQYGGESTGMFAEFGKNDEGKKTVHLTGRYCGYEDVDITFAEGDTAIEDSFNFDFLGEIVSISPKTVGIRAQYQGRVTRLDLATFANRNRSFSIEKSNAKRAAWSD